MTKLAFIAVTTVAVIGADHVVAEAATCTEVSPTVLEIQLADGENTTVRVDGVSIRAGSRVCAASAVAWDINVLGGAGDESLTLSEVGGSLDGYDWTISLGAGSDSLTIQGNADRNRYGIGTTAGSHVFQFETNATRVAATVSFDVEAFTLRGGANVDYIRGQATTSAGTFVFNRRLNIYGEAGNDVIYGGSDSDVLNGGTQNDRIYGRAGNDTLRGGDGNDILNGEAGNDSLAGQAGADTENGGNGNDNFTQGASANGNDRLDGGAGDDTVSYSGRLVSLTIDLLAGQATIGAETDTLIALENARGGRGDDLLSGTDGKNRLYGGDGDDHLEGLLGNDLLNCGAGDDTWEDPDSLGGLTCETQLP